MARRWLRHDSAALPHVDTRETLVKRVVLSLPRLASRKTCKLDADTRRFKPLAILSNIYFI